MVPAASSGLAQTAAGLAEGVREALARPASSRPSTAGSDGAPGSKQKRRRKGQQAAGARPSQVPQAAKLAEQRSLQRRAARSHLSAAWLAWQSGLLQSCHQAGMEAGPAAAAAAAGQASHAAQDENDLIHAAMGLPGIKDFLGAEEGLTLGAGPSGDELDSDVDSDLSGEG